MNKIERPAKSLSRIEGLSHRAVSGEFLNADVCRGKKDGKRAPDAWSAALQAIEAEETKVKDDARSAIRQTQGEAHSHLEHTDGVLRQNKESQEKMKSKDALPPMSEAEVQHASAKLHVMIAVILTMMDGAGVLYIAKKIFGGNIFLIAPIGFLMPAGMIFGIKTLLEHLKPERKILVAKALMYIGIALVAVALVGLAVLRTIYFNAALSGDGAVNINGMAYGDLLLTIGLCVGLPLILAVFYEKESTKRKAAKIALALYIEEKELLNAKNEWTALSRRLQEIDERIDGITANIIKLRQNRYIRGYIKGVRKNPDAKHYIDAILKRNHTAIPERPLTLETVETRRN